MTIRNTQKELVSIDVNIYDTVICWIHWKINAVKHKNGIYM